MNDRGKQIGVVELQTDSSQVTQLQFPTTTQAEMERPKYVTCYSSQQQDHVYIILPCEKHTQVKHASPAHT